MCKHERHQWASSDAACVRCVKSTVSDKGAELDAWDKRLCARYDVDGTLEWVMQQMVSYMCIHLRTQVHGCHAAAHASRSNPIGLWCCMLAWKACICNMLNRPSPHQVAAKSTTTAFPPKPLLSRSTASHSSSDFMCVTGIVQGTPLSALFKSLDCLC